MSIDEIINDYGTDEKGEQAFEDAQWPREFGLRWPVFLKGS
jgi:hypothetical protein